MFNKNRTIEEQLNTIEDLEEAVRTWIRANDLAQVAFDTQSRLVDVLNETIELHEAIKKQNNERIKTHKETIEVMEERIEIKDKYIVLLLEQNIGLIK